MGLFSNNKKPCPICGNATPRLLPTKVEGVPICKECDKKIDLPNGVLDSMTLDDFRRYIDFYNKNQVLRERFHPEYRFGFGAFNTQLVLDVTNGLFRLKDDESTIVFEKSALKSFRITEDKEPLFTGTAAGLVCAESKNPERVRLLAPRIEQFKLQRSDYERIMQAERVQYLDRTNEEWRERERELEFHKPEFRESSPFRQFVVELELDHPYWKSYRNELDAPEFDDDYPSVDSFLHKYDEKVNELHTLARNLMQFIAPGAPESPRANRSALVISRRGCLRASPFPSSKTVAPARRRARSSTSGRMPSTPSFPSLPGARFRFSLPWMSGMYACFTFSLGSAPFR